MAMDLKGKELERFKELKKRMGTIEKAIPGVKFFSLAEDNSLDIERKPSGSYKVDKILGGGLPEGRIIELFGKPSSGKTTLSIVWAAEYTKRKEFVLFIDAEQAFDAEYAEKLGIDLNYFVVMQPDYGEQAFDVLKAAIQSGVYSYIIVDSVSALTPKSEFDKNLEDEAKIGALARMMSRGLSVVSKLASNANVTITFINQTRVKIGAFSPFGTPEDTTGGNALKFYTSIRVDVRRAEDVKRKDEKIGQFTKVRTIKNKTYAPFKEALIKLMFDEANNKWGVDSWEEYFDEVVSENMLGEKGRYNTLTGERIKGEDGIPGKDMLRKFLKENKDQYDYLVKKIEKKEFKLERDEEMKVIDFKVTKIKEDKEESKEETINEEVGQKKDEDSELISIIKDSLKNGENMTGSTVVTLAEKIQGRTFSMTKGLKLLKTARGE